MRLLVTGFGPFPTMPRNPSAALAEAVSASPRFRVRGVEATSLILITAYGALAGQLEPALATQPDAVLLIGVAGRSPRVRVEGRATSRQSALFPDVDGQTGGAAPAAAVRRTSVNPQAALLVLRRHGVPARISRDAGRYLCNAAYFLALGRSGPTLFLHVPKPRGSRPGVPAQRYRCAERDRMVAGMVEIGLTMLRDARTAALRNDFDSGYGRGQPIGTELRTRA